METPETPKAPDAPKIPEAPLPPTPPAPPMLKAAKAPESKPEQTTAPVVRTPTMVEFAGSPGRPFALYGENFGQPRGFILFDGRPAEVTSWTDNKVKGTVPAEMERGEVTLTVAGATFKVKVA